MDVVATPNSPTNESLNVFMELDSYSFEGQSPAPFTPIPSPAPSPRVVPASLRILSSFDTDSGVQHQTHSSIQHLSPSEGSSTQTSRDMLLLEFTNSLSQNFNVSDKPHAPATLTKTRYREAEELDLRRRLDQFTASHGSNHPATLYTMSRLGQVLQSQGRLCSAEDCFKAVAEQSRVLHGEDDLRTLEAFLNLASILDDQGNMAPAEKLCRNLLRKAVNLIPDEHSLNLQINILLGLCLLKLGRLQEAEHIFNEVIKLGHRAALQPDDGLLLRPMKYLASLRCDQGEFVEAERTLLAILTARGGDRHSRDLDTMSIRANLGLIYARKGRFQESESLLREISADQTRVLGAEHLETLRTQRYLADVLSREEKHEESEQLMQGVVKILEKTRGKHHIDTLRSRCTLTMMFIAQGRFEEAEVSAKQVLNLAIKTLGEDHDICYAAVYHLGRSYEGQHRLQEALHMLTRAWEGFVRIWGEGHAWAMDSKRRFTDLQVRVVPSSNADGIQSGGRT